MPEVTSHAPGSFCWIELNTSDPAAAKKFYSGLFSWEAEDTPAGPDMVYTMLRIRGLEVGAMCGLQPEQKAHGVPPHWMSYVAVQSADDAADVDRGYARHRYGRRRDQARGIRADAA